MSESDQVMLYRDEVNMLLRHLKQIRDLYQADHGPHKRKNQPLREYRVFHLLDLWIERLQKVLYWR